MGLQSGEKGSGVGRMAGNRQIYREGGDAFEGGRVKRAVAAWVQAKNSGKFVVL